mmetsp:Transcript_69782/g.145874  ORF Transcript_69782/g.145874 Transcript_69782/m.145874 type:complete len:319 (+) Transcript_69782:212-1168(+)
MRGHRWDPDEQATPVAPEVAKKVAMHPKLAQAAADTAENGTVVAMKHFPRSWQAPAAVAELPQKIAKMLLKFGPLAKQPLLLPRSAEQEDDMVVAVAVFKEAAVAKEVASVLKGTDMRSKDEKAAGGAVTPRDLFDITVVSEEAPKAREEGYLLIRGFPQSWGEAQVKWIFSAFGGISSLTFVPDPLYARACRLTLKDESKMAQIARDLDGTIVGDGNFIEECLIFLHYEPSIAERRKREIAVAKAEAAAAAAAASKAKEEAKEAAAIAAKAAAIAAAAAERERQEQEQEQEAGARKSSSLARSQAVFGGLSNPLGPI